MSFRWSAGMTIGCEEPRLHTHIEDGLDDGHPLAFVHLGCDRCHDLLHAGNNECMTAWVETGRGNFCIGCFVALLKEEGDLECVSPENGWGIGRQTIPVSSERAALMNAALGEGAA